MKLRVGWSHTGGPKGRPAVTLITALVVSLLAASVAFAATDQTGRAVGYWDAYEESLVPYAPYTESRTDQTGRAVGYWQEYQAAVAPYAPYTAGGVDSTGRAAGYWKAYEAEYTTEK